MPTSKPIGWFTDWLNERAKGELTVKWVGGPEVIPGVNQPDAVKTGAIDIAMFPSTFVESAVPEAYGITVTQYMPWEERANGFYDYMVQLFKQKMGVHYLGRPEINAPFYTCLKVPVAKPKDMAGLKIGITGGQGKPFMAALGAATVFVPNPELYTALERGMINGFLLPIDNAEGYSLFEVTKYLIDYPYYAGNLVLLMNYDKWSSLPPHLQKLVNDTIVDMEKEVATWRIGVVKAARQKFLDKGVKAITFSDEDAKFYVDTAYSALFDDWQKKISPEAYQKLRGFLIKK